MRKKYVTIIILALLGLCLLCIGSTATTAYYLATRPYEPDFSSSRVVVRTTAGEVHIFYKTEDQHAVGDDIDELTLISANTMNLPGDQSKVSGPSYYTELATEVDQVGEGYVLLVFPMFNLDCLGAYVDGKPEKIFFASNRDLLPSPSDSWICSYYDFSQPLN